MQLSQDFQIFRASLEEGQPGIYRYTSKDDMDRIFAHAEESLRSPMTTTGFYDVLAPVLASIHCGHSELLLPKTLQEQVRQHLLPFDLRVIDGNVFILHDFSSESEALAGKQLVSINGVAIDRILRVVENATPGDGHSETIKPYRLGYDGALVQALGPLFSMWGPFHVEYLPGNGAESKQIVVDAQPADKLEKIARRRYGVPHSVLHAGDLDFMDNGRIAVLHIYGMGGVVGIFTPLKTFIAHSFEKIHDRGTQVLIVDVRDNGGGQHELGEELFSFLTSSPFLYYKDLVINKRSFDFMRYADSSTPLPDSRVKPGADGKYHDVGEANWGMQQPRKPYFGGKVIVLMNGGSFSATAEFLAMTKSFTSAVLVGDESGGDYEGNNSGMKYDITLPNSKVVLRMPVVGYHMAVLPKQPLDRGVLPDISVHYSIQEMLGKQDKEMSVALGLARQSLSKISGHR